MESEKYNLATFEDNKFDPVKIIDQNMYDLLVDYCDRIKFSHNQLVIFKYLQLNIKEYSIFVEKFSKIPVTQLKISTLNNQSFLLETNKLVLNVLTSFVFFLDNAKTFLTRKFRNDETIINDFKKLTNHHYDNSFAYRFLTKLRNYSIHLGFPLRGIGFNVEEINENPEKMFGDIQLLIDIDLLKKEKDLLAGIYKEVSNINDDINLKPLIYDLSKSILEIQKYIYSVQKSEIEHCIQKVESFAREFKTSTNEIVIYHVSQRINDDAELLVYEIPFQMIEDFKVVKTAGNRL